MVLYQKLGGNVSIKLHFLDQHPDFSLEDLDEFSDNRENDFMNVLKPQKQNTKDEGM